MARSPVVQSLIITIALACFSGSAHAQDKARLAQQHYERGTAFFQQRMFDQALVELNEAFRLDPNPSLVYNIARCHEEKGDLHEAIKFFKSFLLTSNDRRAKRRIKKKLRRLRALAKRLPSTGVVTLTTEPQGATVRIDGRVVGVTPMTLGALRAGVHSLELSLANYQRHVGSIRVAAGRTTPINVVLQDAPSTVVISTQPAGAEATLLGASPRSLGRCPCVFKAGAGNYNVRVSKSGFPSKTIQFFKKAGEDLQITVNLSMPQTFGHLLLNVPIAGAEIRVNGVTEGSSPLSGALRLTPGMKTIEVVAPGYQPWRTVIRVNAGQVSRLTANLRSVSPVVTLPRPTLPALQKDTTALTSWGWAFTGIGIAAVLGGGATTTLMLLEKRKYDNSKVFRLETGQLARTDMSRADAFKSQDFANLMLHTSIGLYSGGMACILTGIIMISNDDGPPGLAKQGGTQWGVNPLPGGAMINLNTPF